MQNSLKVVSQRNLSPEIGWVDIRCDRASVLGNPFDMGKDESLRDTVCQAYREWLWENIQLAQRGEERRVDCKRWGLRIATTYKNPTSLEVYNELLSIAGRLLADQKVRLLCWCKRSDRDVVCHVDIIVRCLIWLNRTNP